MKNILTLNDLNCLNNEKTLLVTVDMINGFIKEGHLHSSSIKRIIPTVKLLNSQLNNSARVFFSDSHESDSLEFKNFPKHCIVGSRETEIIDELKELSQSAMIYSKSTTNGYWTYEFRKLLENNSFDNVIITGCCTDICILNLALTLNTYFISNKENTNIIVVENGVDTFDSPEHNADEYNRMTFKILKANGITLFSIKE